MKLTRDFYIPRSSTKIADRQSDAVAYIYISPKGNFGAAIFFGTQAKPVSNYVYKSAALREVAVTKAFEHRRQQASTKLAYKAERKEKATAFAKSITLGDIFHYSYGYDETHHCFVQVVGIKGRHVITRAIQQAQEDLGYDWRHRCMPQTDAFHGEPERHLVQDGMIRIGHHYASKWNTHEVAGVKMGPAYTGGGCH